MEELLARLNPEFDEAEGWIRIVDADWYEESISSVGEEILTVLSDSPLLIPYREIEVDLFFSENLCNPASLLGLIFSSCIEVFKKSEYLERFLNQKPTLSGIVSSKFGTLGRFPKPLADRIVQTLKDEPIRVSPTEVGLPKLWTGTEFADYPSLSVFELGASYVIGESFSASRA